MHSPCRDNTPVSRKTNWRSADMNIALMTHYYGGRGTNTALGMELSANGNVQTTAVWLRGAGRQHGLSWWMDMSEFTRFGYKRQDCKQAAKTSNPCKDELCLNGTSSQGDGGVRCGTSYSLFKRAMLSCILYDSASCGFADEQGCDPKATGGVCQQVAQGEMGGYLSPIGLIQRGSKQWVAKHAGTLGVQLSTTALLLDHNQGWLRPSDVCRSDDPNEQQNENVWGTIPYAAHDWFVLNALDQVYPGFVNGNLLRNESGIFAPTPFGDTLDALLIDVHEDILATYDTVIVGGLLKEEAREASRKLSQFVARGGRLFITADSLSSLSSDGISLGTSGRVVIDSRTGCTTHTARTVVTMHSELSNRANMINITEPSNFTTCALKTTTPPHHITLASAGGVAIAVELTSPIGGGSVVVIGSVDGGVAPTVRHNPRNPCFRGSGLSDSDNLGYQAPRVLLAHVQLLLKKTLRKPALFDLGAELAWVVKRVSSKEYVLGVQNPEVRPVSLTIKSRLGAIQSIQEISTDTSVNETTPGWVPAGYENRPLGQSGNATIAGLSMRIFRVRIATVGGQPATTTAEVAPLNASHYESQPKRLLRFGHDVGNLQHELMARPSFKTRFHGIVLDSAFVHSRTMDELMLLGDWLAMNNYTVAIDFSRVINVFPYPPRSFRLYTYMPAEYNKSMAMFMDVLQKLPAIGATDILLTLHQSPPGNQPTSAQVAADVAASIKQICVVAAKHRVTVHLRQAFKNDNMIPSESLYSTAQFCFVVVV